MELLTSGQAATIGGVSARTSAIWLDKGMVEGHRVPSPSNKKCRRYVLSSLLKLLAKSGYADTVLIGNAEKISNRMAAVVTRELKVIHAATTKTTHDGRLRTGGGQHSDVDPAPAKEVAT